MSAISCCRSCRAETLESVLDLGSTPLANSLLTDAQRNQPEDLYPLHLVWCPACTLLQITENVPAETLFSHYFYRSSFSDSFLEHCKCLAERMIGERQLTEKSLVVDIASNDGYLLQFYKEKGIPVLGIEPAANIAMIAQGKGIPTRNTFFSRSDAEQIVSQSGRADVIHAHNVLPHVADQRDFVSGIATLLQSQGIAVIEFAYAIDTIDHTEFDQVYHEHLCYFSLTAFTRLCEQFDLTVVRVERIAMHGGSLRVFLAHKNAQQPDSTVAALLSKEQSWGVGKRAPYRKFAERAAVLKENLITLLHRLQAEGNRIVVYGASAKGSTLMHYCGIDSSLVEYIVDRSTMKQGLYAPSTHLRIEPVEKLLENQPDYVLLLTWNFANEILEQQKQYCKRGGRFIVPIPEVRIV